MDPPRSCSPLLLPRSHESFECQRDYTNTYILMSEGHKLSTNFGNLPVEWIKLTWRPGHPGIPNQLMPGGTIAQCALINY